MDVFDLFAKIKLDSSGYEKGLNAAKELGSKVAGGIATAFKVSTAAIAAAGTAVAGLTKQSLDAVASYEQLVGGVDKIFGESSKKVQEYANQAFSTAGLSANEYMETVTSFSASLLQSLGGNTEKAADTANRAIIDMADNMNTYGSSMESIQNAYQGFAKQNYTMLDNLKLGYGGTKEEMERLIADASQMTGDMQELGVVVDADSTSFGNIINAISVMQHHLKISGTTAKEAGGTISGSVASMKAAWQNFLTGTGSPAQFTEVLKNSIGNIRNNLKDIIPRLTEGLTELVDLIAPEIPPIIEETLPSIIDGASTLLTGLANRLPQLLTAILPSLAEGVVDVTTALVGVLPDLITSLKKSIPIVVQTIMSKKDELFAAGKEIISAIVPTGNGSLEKVASGASAIVTKFATTITSPENITKVFDKGADILDAILSGLTSEESINALLDEENGIPKLLSNIGTTLVNLVDRLLDSAQKVVENLCKYLTDEENQENIDNAAIGILTALGEAFVGLVRTIHHHIVDLMSNVAVQMVGEFDADATAFDMLSALAKALVRNAWRFSPFGAVQRIWNEHREQEAMEDYLNSDSPLTYERYLEEQERQITQQNSYVGGADYFASEYMLQHGYLQGAAADAYRRARGYATGFYADRPAWLNNVQVGERGDEVLLPLDTNTAWMDKLADKLGARMGGGIVVQFGDIHVHGNGNVGQEVISQIDSALRQYQIQQQRGIGGTGWQK